MSHDFRSGHQSAQTFVMVILILVAGWLLYQDAVAAHEQYQQQLKERGVR